MKAERPLDWVPCPRKCSASRIYPLHESHPAIDTGSRCRRFSSGAVASGHSKLPTLILVTSSPPRPALRCAAVRDRPKENAVPRYLKTGISEGARADADAMVRRTVEDILGEVEARRALQRLRPHYVSLSPSMVSATALSPTASEPRPVQARRPDSSIAIRSAVCRTRSVLCSTRRIAKPFACKSESTR